MRLPHILAASAIILLAAFLFQQAMALPYYTPIGPGALPAIEWPTLRGLVNAAATIAALAAAAALLRPLGFRLTLAAILLGLVLLFGFRRPVATAVLVLAGSLGTYQLFHGVLRAPLPVGMFGF